MKLLLLRLQIGVSLQDELAKRHCFASVLYIAKTLVDRGTGAVTLPTRSNVSLSQILSVFDVGYDAKDYPNMAYPRPETVLLHLWTACTCA